MKGKLLQLVTVYDMHELQYVSFCLGGMKRTQSSSACFFYFGVKINESTWQEGHLSHLWIKKKSILCLYQISAISAFILTFFHFKIWPTLLYSWCHHYFDLPTELFVPDKSSFVCAYFHMCCRGVAVLRPPVASCHPQVQEIHVCSGKSARASGWGDVAWMVLLIEYPWASTKKYGRSCRNAMASQLLDTFCPPLPLVRYYIASILFILLITGIKISLLDEIEVYTPMCACVVDDRRRDQVCCACGVCLKPCSSAWVPTAASGGHHGAHTGGRYGDPQHRGNYSHWPDCSDGKWTLLAGPGTIKDVQCKSLLL